MSVPIAPIFQDAPTFLASLDTDLICLEISRGWRDHLGLAESTDNPKLSLGCIFALEDTPELEKDLQRILIDQDALLEIPVSLNGKAGNSHGLLSAWCEHYPQSQKRLMLSAICSEQLENSLNELWQLRNTHELILNSAGEGIYGIDRNGLTTFGNAASKRILGWNPTEIMGTLAHNVHHHSRADGSPYPHEECPIYEAIRDGRVHNGDDEVFWNSKGEPVPVEYTSTPIWHNDEIQGAVIVFRDISERKEAEQQKEAAYQEINKLKEQLELERDYLRDEIKINADFGEFIGSSSALKSTMAQIEAVATTSASVLVLGESGVGKEMVARAIHAQSPRADKSLIKVNCASIPKDLFESEFFGHVKGAFTGAHKDRVGRLQLADQGTIFLDEVGEIPLDLQGKLLRALQEQEFERVGDDNTVKVDVRLVAATNRDLEEAVKAGEFREDLYYRLSVFPISVPPLRERLDDISHLSQHFLERSCTDLGRDPIRITQLQIETLQRHNWPGNIRELKNVIERAVILSQGERLRLDLAMPGSFPEPSHASAPDAIVEKSDFMTDQQVREIERNNMIAALQKANGRVWGSDGAAELLGIKPSTLAYRMKTLDISWEEQ